MNEQGSLFPMSKREIGEAVEKNELHYKEALELLKQMPKPWHTKEWKEKRAELIDDKCAVCGTSEGILVLQHTRQPLPFNLAFDFVFEKEFEEELKEIAKHVVALSDKEVKAALKPQTEKRSSCPDCGSVSVRYRKNYEFRYSCTRGHDFNEPVKVDFYTKSKSSNFEKVKMTFKRRAFLREYGKLKRNNDREIGRLALLFTIFMSEEYHSFEHTKTCCKRCAFREDKERGYVDKRRYQINEFWKFAPELF